MKLKVDVREKRLIKLLQAYIVQFEFKKIDIVIENLPLGDVIICDKNDNEKIIVERKSLNDLASSIKDGRYVEQSHRLTNNPVHNHNIVYLVEGNLSTWTNRYKVQSNTLYSAIFSLNYYKGFSVIKTHDITETAEYILRMCDKLNREKKKVSYLESGEKNDKKGRNSWTVMTTTLNARRKLKQLEIYKNKKGIKPKLKSPTKLQKEKQKNQSVKVQKYPNKPPGMGGIRHQETKKRDNRIIRAHMEEQASRIPGGMNNTSLQRMMKRFPKSPRQQKLDSMDLNMSADQQGWYKDQFKNELNSMVDKTPYTPPALPPGNPPPPPPEAARRQVEDIQRVVYGSKKNDNSPKMTIRELNLGEN